MTVKLTGKNLGKYVVVYSDRNGLDFSGTLKPGFYVRDVDTIQAKGVGEEVFLDPLLIEYDSVDVKPTMDGKYF